MITSRVRKLYSSGQLFLIVWKNPFGFEKLNDRMSQHETKIKDEDENSIYAWHKKDLHNEINWNKREIKETM